MARILENKLLPEFVKILRSDHFPKSLPLYYLAQKAIVGRYSNIEVITDNWPTFGAAIVRQRPGTRSGIRWTQHLNEHAVYAKNVDSLGAIMGGNMISYTDEIIFTNIPADQETMSVLEWHAKKLSEAGMGQWSRAGLIQHIAYVTRLNKMPKPDIPEGYSVGALTASDVDIVVEQCSDAEPRTVAYIRDIIEHEPSSAIRDKGTGELLAFCHRHGNGALAMAFHEDEQWGSALPTATLYTCMEQTAKLDEPVVGYIFVDTVSSIGDIISKSFQSIGFTVEPDSGYICLRFSPHKAALADSAEEKTRGKLPGR